ncbi:Uncharacterized conserved protein, DUF4415 family [Sphingomonas laterariae]|uniref:Uncharacterized conserved protein, DUF4415 family n=1 Tax=Edaphosphingomonas laterariae TaxID=861865 RepID=A0A239CLI7_9SPHN|nr:BrnA antitoxin family protein [Sphingomonas laterariae]SNS20762.1 Uncharacterized conserved protein, DUF4415 family [Sphingomonas laterariae]
MAKKAWPSFVTKDLGNSDADAAEMERRWLIYRDEMSALIAAGGVHQDDDGWWVCDATGELIGPDPEIERPLNLREAGAAVSFDQAFPGLAAKMRPPRGAQKKPTKVSTTIRLSPDVLAHFRASGEGWQSRIDAALKEWIAAH